MKGIYLCAFYAEHPQADLDYQDRFIQRDIGKPFIIENVKNDPMFKKYGIYENAKGLYIYRFGRHTYFTNIKLDLSEVSQINDSIANISHSRREGGENVKRVIDKFIETIGGFSNDQ